MTVASETNKVTYAGDASTTTFSTAFTFASDDEVNVTLVDSTTGGETAFTRGTQYTLTGAGTGSAGTVTIVTSPTDYTPASGKKLVIQLAPDFLQQTDLPRGGTVSPADTLEPMHDSRVRQMLRLKDELDRAIKVPIDETSASNLPNVTSRAGKILTFDSSGNPEAGDEIGDYKGDWAASTYYAKRDLVKDTSTNNIFRANTSHTSSGSQPLTTNTDSAKWDLVVDAASASASATAAASSATASASSATSSATAQAASETAQAASEAARDSATASASSATSSAATATTKSSEAATSATAAAASAASAAGNAGTQSVDRFNGNGSTTAFTMSASPATENNTAVYISGVYQQKDTYSTSGTTLTFSTAPPTGTGNIEVMHMSTLPTGISPTVGTTTTGAAGTNASVSISGHELSFTIPRGDTGATGQQGSQGVQGNVGTAATIAAGSTTTGAAGSNAAVTNVGSSSAATFNFTVPRGDTGATGPQGIQGIQGDTGPAGSLSGASDGTAGAPSISFSADTDTGVYRPGADQLGFTTGGSGRMTINADGTTAVTPTSAGAAQGLAVYGSGMANGSNMLFLSMAANTGNFMSGNNSSGQQFSISHAGHLSKTSGSFKIEHPLPAKKDTHHLVHSFIEGPQADLIYRGTADLVSGVATVNIDTAAGMTDGTFVVLCTDVQCFTSNEDGWTALKGAVTGNILTITAQDDSCTDTVSWLVVGERCDPHMLETEWTDAAGKVIVEPLKPEILETN